MKKLMKLLKEETLLGEKILLVVVMLIGMYSLVASVLIWFI